jgi:hypothetical protein
MQRTFGPIASVLFAVSLLALTAVVMLPDWLSRHLPTPGMRAVTSPASSPSLTIGAQVRAVDSAPVGQVSGISRTATGHIHRIRIATEAPLGFGSRTVTVREDAFKVEGNSVHLRLTVSEVNALPTVMTEDGAAASMGPF